MKLVGCLPGIGFVIFRAEAQDRIANTRETNR